MNEQMNKFAPHVPQCVQDHWNEQFAYSGEQSDEDIKLANEATYEWVDGKLIGTLNGERWLWDDIEGFSTTL